MEPSSMIPSGRARWLGVATGLLLLAVLWPRAATPVSAQAPTSQQLSVAFSASGDVIVSWRNTPGNSTDWVSVIRAGAPDDTYESTWTYTNGQRSGSYNAGSLSPGDYEARLYLDWPSGGYLVVDRLSFRVGADSSGGAFASSNLEVFIGADRGVVVNWRGTPGNNQDWVSVVRAGTPDDVYESTWAYTGGQRVGSYDAGRLAPGEYEARLYLDWPSGGYRVVDRVRFRVP